MSNATRQLTTRLAIALMAAGTFASVPALADRTQKEDETDMPTTEHQSEASKEVPESEASTETGHEGVEADSDVPASKHQKETLEDEKGADEGRS